MQRQDDTDEPLQLLPWQFFPAFPTQVIILMMAQVDAKDEGAGDSPKRQSKSGEVVAAAALSGAATRGGSAQSLAWMGW